MGTTTANLTDAALIRLGHIDDLIARFGDKEFVVRRQSPGGVSEWVESIDTFDGSAQRATVTALGTHTCLSAQVWSEDQVRATYAKGYSIGKDLCEAIKEADRVLQCR